MALLQALKTRMYLHWGLLLFGTIGLFGYVLRATGWFTEIPGDLGDARFNSVVLEHLFLWTRGLTDGLWDPGFFYPFDNTLAYSDNHFGSGAVYILSRYLGMDRITAFQVWFAIGNIVNLMSAYYVLRKLGYSTLAAGLGAFIFAFALPVLPKEGHAQLVYRFASPLAFLAFWQGFEAADLKKFGVCGFWVAWQFYCSVYLGFFLTLLLLGLGIGLIVSAGPRWLVTTIRRLVAANGRQWVFTLAMIAVAGGLVGTLLHVYSATGKEYEFHRSFDEVATMLPRIQSYFLADYSTIWGSASRQIGESLQNRHEHQMFLGLGVIVLAATGFVVAWRGGSNHHLVRASSVALVLLTALTLVTPFGTLYSMIAQLPGISSIRAVSRIIVIMVLPVALLCAFGADWLERRVHETLPRAAGKAAIALLILLAAGESVSFLSNNTPETAWRDRQAALEAQLPDTLDSHSILYVTDVQGADPTAYLTELDAVIVAQAHHIPTLNGYSGNTPPGYIRPSPCTGASMRLSQAFGHLRKTDISVADIIAHTKTVALSPCPINGQNLPLSGLVDERLPSAISITLKAADMPGQFVAEIHNKSDLPLATQSVDGHSVYASWRIVPRDPVAGQPGWDSRLPVDVTIASGEMFALSFDVPQSALSAARAVQFSLVQEGYFWFHDRGMTPGNIDLEAEE